jgi:hypothetical protein
MASQIVDRLLKSDELSARWKLRAGVLRDPVLAALADIGYPPGDEALRPMAEQLQEAWLADDFYREFEATSKASVHNRRGVPVMEWPIETAANGPATSPTPCLSCRRRRSPSCEPTCETCLGHKLIAICSAFRIRGETTACARSLGLPCANSPNASMSCRASSTGS